MPFPPPPPDEEAGSLVTTPISRSGNNARAKRYIEPKSSIRVTEESSVGEDDPDVENLVFSDAQPTTLPESPLRAAIVKYAFEYYNKNITEINNMDFRYGRGKIINGQRSPGIKATDFENELKSVGIYIMPEGHWCSGFAKLIYKKAYEEIGLKDPVIADIKTRIYTDFAKGNVDFTSKYDDGGRSVIPDVIKKNSPFTVNCQRNYNNFKNLAKFKTLISDYERNLNANMEFVTGKTQIFPGDCIQYLRGNGYGHINICVASDNTTRIHETIGGNESNTVLLQKGLKHDKKPRCIIRPYDNVAPPSTFKEDQYKIFAKQIQDALSGVQEDETVVYGVMEKMKTDTDIKKLREAYGTRIVSGGFLPFQSTLDGHLKEYFFDSEIAQVNVRLEKNKIKREFLFRNKENRIVLPNIGGGLIYYQ